MALIIHYGERWARNDENIKHVPHWRKTLDQEFRGQGVYVLYDGSMPVYIGKGNLRKRIDKARSSSYRGQFGDRFSW